MNLLELKDALGQLADFIAWERETLEDFHRYAHRFGGRPGSNVFQFALEDALRYRGVTLEQFRTEISPSPHYTPSAPLRSNPPHL
jgi:hypothetical protein